MTKVSSLKALMRLGRCIVGVGARDALDARLIEQAGFDFVWASSFCVSAAHCVPDAGILSGMNESTSIPVLFDADTGYGGPEHVAYATRRVAESGISGLCIEDKCFPKQSSLLPDVSHALVSSKEFAEKIRAAVDARPTPAADEKVRRLIRRLRLSAADAELLMGMLRQMEWKMKKIG